MSGTRRDVELAIRVQDLGIATFDKVKQAVNDLTADLDKQVAAAARGAISAGELKESLEKLKQAGDALKSQGSLIDRYQGLTEQLNLPEAALSAATAKQNEYTPTLKKNGEETAAATAKQASYQAAVDRASTALEKTRATLAALATTLQTAGLDTSNLTEAQNQLKNVAGQVGAANTTLSASLSAYAGNVRRAREETQALAAAEKARAAPGFISPNTAAPREASSPGFVRPSIPQVQQDASVANQTGILGLRAYELQNLGYQINDVVTQLLSGTKATQVAAQQSGQILQIFNRNLFDLLPLLPRVAAALAVAGFAFEAVSRAMDIASSTRQFRADLAATVEGTRYSADSLTRTRISIEDYGVAWEDAGTLIQKAVEVGLNPARITQFAKVAQDLTDRTGAKFPAVAESLIRVFTGPLDGIIKLNEQYGFWTQAEIEANRELAEAGRLSEVQVNALAALEEKQKAATANLSPFTKAMRDAKTVWRELLDISGEAFSSAFAPEIAGITATWKALAAAIHYAADGVKRYRDGSLNLPSAPGAADSGRGGPLNTAGIPSDIQPIVTQVAALVRVSADQIGQLYRNEAVRNADGSYKQGQPNHTGELAEGPFQVLPSTFNTLRAQFKDLFDQLAADIKKPVDIKTNEFNALAGSLYYMQQLKTYGDPGRAAGAYFAGPGNFDLYEQGRTNPAATKAIKAYIDKFLAGLGQGVAPGSPASLTAAGDRSAAAQAGAEPGGGDGLASTQSKVAAGAKLIEDLRNQLIVTRALRDEETDRVRINEAGKKAIEGISNATDGQLKTMRAIAEDSERQKINTERYAFAQKEATETARSGANAARDRLAYEKGVAEALANGVRTQAGLDSAGDRARANVRAVDDLRNQLIVTRALRDEATDRVRIDEAGRRAITGVTNATREQLVDLQRTAQEAEKSKIAAERYAFAQKEAVEAVRSGANLARDKAAFDKGVQEAYANGVRNQNDLDAAGDRARTEARAKRLKEEQAILDVEAQAARTARFKEFAPDVIAAGQAKVNELMAKGVTTVETLRAARNQAEDELFARLERNKALQNQGDSLQSQLASLTRGDLKSPLQEINTQLRAVEEGYAGLLRRVEQFKTAGGTTIGKGATAVPVQQFEQEIAASQRRTEALTRLKAAEQAVNQIVQERNALVRTVDDLVMRGQVSIGQGEELKKKAYEETNKALLPAIEIWDRVRAAAQLSGDVSGVTLDLVAAKIQQVRVETEKLDPLVAQLQKGIPEAVGSAVVRGMETVSQSITNLVNGTGKLSDVFKAFGTAAIQILADVAKMIAETILKYYVMQAVSSATSGAGGAGGLLGKLFGAGGSAAAGAVGTGGSFAVGDAAAIASAGMAIHTGGVVGQGGWPRQARSSWFANAPRLHKGGLPGLAHDEVAAVLQKGEEVLAANDPRNVLNGGGMDSGGIKSIRNVFVFDPETLPAAMKSAQGEQVVLHHIKRNAAAIRQIVG